MLTDKTIKSKFRVKAAVHEMQDAGLPITIKAVADRVGLVGLSGVRSHLLELERDGLIDLHRGSKIAAAA